MSIPYFCLHTQKIVRSETNQQCFHRYVLEELYETERQYVEHLGIIAEVS